MDSKASSEANFRQSNALHDWLKAAFLRLIAEETGLEIKKHDQATLDTQIFARMKALKISFAEDYYQLLVSKTLESYQEWQNLIRLLTNPESFFFRDQGHFQLLEKHIIPDLIQRKRTTRTIRVCSAGCSTGEEPYSLAILFKELIPDLDQWNLCILGLDVNSLSLEKAKAGIYRPWSFRTVDPEIRGRYFKIINHEYHIAPEIKQMLRFQTLNLVKDSFPDPQSEMRDMDLIVCRNVFIYFEETAISTVLEKFYNTLQPHGYLLTGHTELYMQNLSRFQAQVFPEAMIYQRLDDPYPTSFSADTQDYRLRVEAIDKSSVENQIQQTSRIEPTTQVSDNLASKVRHTSNFAHTKFVRINDAPPDEKELLNNAESLMRRKAYNLAIAQVEKALELNSQNFYSYYLMAQLLQCLDNDESANFFCHTALEIDPSSILPYYVLADITGKQKKWSEMKQILKKIIYLEPGAIAAYLKLSYIYQAENDLERMHKMQSVALKILQQLPPDMEILEVDFITVAQLILQLETSLSQF